MPLKMEQLSRCVSDWAIPALGLAVNRGLIGRTARTADWTGISRL